MKRHVAVALAAWVAFAGGLAVAQTSTTQGLDIERFKPAMDSQGIFLTEGGQGEESGNLNLGFWLHYQHDPLVVSRNGSFFKALVEDRVAADFLVSMGMTNWLTIGVDVPAVFYQTGNTLDSTGKYGDLTAAALGDIRVSPKFTLLREKTMGISLAVDVPVSLPSGDENAYMGSNNVTVAPTLALSRHFFKDSLLLALNLGFWIRESTQFQNLQTEHELFYKLGAGFKFVDHWWVLGEASGASRLSDFGQNKREEASLEWLLGFRFDGPKDLHFTLGGAVGSMAGWGTPNFRVFFGLMWAPRVHDRDKDGVDDDVDKCPDVPGPAENQGCPWPDTDKDGVTDNIDQCPNEPGPPENHGCPWGDADKDGVLDNVDKCPNEPGPVENQGCPWPDADKDGVPDKDDRCPNEPGPKENNGCPWGDADKDGVLDNVDKCPNEPGPPENNGCPWGDADKDGVLDNVDKCPNEPGPAENQGCPWPDADKDGIPDKDDQCPNEPGLPENHGCPAKGKVLVIIKKEKIEILQKIHFATGKSTIMRDSYALLDQVYLAIKTHDEIKKVRIEGHTDSVGGPEYNLKLSQDRSGAVLDYLLKRGIPAERMEAVGYGLTKPIADNKTAKGREENRRVEFIIVEE